jgi:tetratricopeptide (TPR) repeat protein
VGSLFRELLGQLPSPEELLDRARTELAACEYQRAARIAHEIADNPDKYSRALRGQALALIAAAERRGGSRTRALESIEEAIGLDPSLIAVLREYGLVLLWMGRMDEADTALSSLCWEVPADARAWKCLGYVRMWTSTLVDADVCFTRAHELDSTIVVPYRATENEFDGRVQQEWRRIPQEFRSRVDRRGMQIRTAPLAEALAVRAGGHPLVRGFCDHMTRAIVLFQRMIEVGCPYSATLQSEVRRVMRHEVGHALGMDEDEVRALSL